MNWKAIFKTQGILLILIAASMSFPLVFALYYRSGDAMAFVKSMAITLATGLLLALSLRPVKELRAREGFIIVSLGWLFAAFFGSLPFLFSGIFGTNYIDCLFETISGFTTTGATLLHDIEATAKGLLFWRSQTQWLGGMGIILLAIIILPTLGLSSTQLFRAEVPGPAKEKISPKIKNTALILWAIYIGMTLLQTILLMLGGMDLYNALSHSFSTVATGGFSTRNHSIASFQSLYIEMVILVFMFLSGTSFVLHFSLIKGRFKEILHNREWRFYSFVVFVSILFATFSIYFSASQNNFWTSLRFASFQVVSIATSTGYITANYESWPVFVHILLLLLMFSGACSGSTAGGVKQIRLLIAIKFIVKEIKKASYPNAKFSLKLGNETVSEDMLKNVLAFILLFIAIFAISTLFLSLRGYDLVTSFSASLAALSNIGPALSKIGASANYAFFDNASKILLSFLMLLGRLELYSLLIFFYFLLRPGKIY